MRTGILPLALSAVLLVPWPSAGQESKARPVKLKQAERSPAPDRASMESLERQLEKAVGRVSVPHPGILLGRASLSRGYRLPGYGVVYVLAPRALPGERQVFVMRRHGPGPEDVRVEHHVTVPGPGPHWEPEQVDELERQVLVLQHAAEARRRAAEEDMERIVEDVRVHLEVAGESGEEEGDATSHRGARELSPDVAPLQEMSEPPWKFWFQAKTVDEEERSPEGVMNAVRSAVIEALDARAASVLGLGPEEWVTVAVDFVPGDVFSSQRRPTRTLIVRARQGDLTARAEGALAAEELRDRVEVIEY
jgi:hypothetical protein